MTKLYSMKSEVRYSPNTIFLKLNGSYMFSQLHVRINEIRRSKMVSERGMLSEEMEKIISLLIKKK